MLHHDETDMGRILVSLTRATNLLLVPACDYPDITAIKFAKKTLSLAEEIYRHYDFEHSPTPEAVYKRIKMPAHAVEEQ